MQLRGITCSWEFWQKDSFHFYNLCVRSVETKFLLMVVFLLEFTARSGVRQGYPFLTFLTNFDMEVMEIAVFVWE